MTTLASTLVATFTTALLGSVHCIAMCGPLATAGCSRDGQVRAKESTGYFLGRFASYALVGGIMGALGEHAIHILPVAVVQTTASLLVGAFAFGRGLRLFWLQRAKASPPLVQLGAVTPQSSTLHTPKPARFWVSLIPRRGLALGLVTGVLPCGMLLAGWALAAGTLHPLYGAAVMVVFALASAPALMLPLLGQRFLVRFTRTVPRHWYAVAWLALGLWLALRPWMAAGHQHH